MTKTDFFKEVFLKDYQNDKREMQRGESGPFIRHYPYKYLQCGNLFIRNGDLFEKKDQTKSTCLSNQRGVGEIYLKPETLVLFIPDYVLKCVVNNFFK